MNNSDLYIINYNYNSYNGNYFYSFFTKKKWSFNFVYNIKIPINKSINTRLEINNIINEIYLIK